MAASFERMTGCEIKGLPKTFRWVAHLLPIQRLTLQLSLDRGLT
jgi:hypothetical protein